MTPATSPRAGLRWRARAPTPGTRHRGDPRPLPRSSVSGWPSASTCSSTRTSTPAPASTADGPTTSRRLDVHEDPVRATARPLRVRAHLGPRDVDRSRAFAARLTSRSVRAPRRVHGPRGCEPERVGHFSGSRPHWPTLSGWRTSRPLAFPWDVAGVVHPVGFDASTARPGRPVTRRPDAVEPEAMPRPHAQVTFRALPAELAAARPSPRRARSLAHVGGR